MDLARNIPNSRAAYSDRTAYLMALLSQFAYEPFEQQNWDIKRFVKAVANAKSELTIEELTEDYRQQLLAPSGRGPATLSAKLEPLGFTLKQVFHEQIGVLVISAFLAVREEDKMAVLSFRGTQFNWRQILVNLKAWQDSSGGSTGFRKAYGLIRHQVTEQLKSLKGYQIFLTGHSLGGALSMMAAYHLSKTSIPGISDQVAACYTFGSPRVGNRDFGSVIKPPIYRIVHLSDVVPRAPLNVYRLIRILAWLAEFIPISRTSNKVQDWFKKTFNHSHYGDFRWISGTDNPQETPSIFQSPGMVEQLLRIWTRQGLSWNKPFEDHRIAVYVEKLATIARTRNH
jgi:triacylglycerol lipase